MRSFLKAVFARAVGTVLGAIALLVIVVILGGIGFRAVQHAGSDIIEKNSILHLRLSGDLVEKHRPLDFELFGERSIFSDERTIGLWEVSHALDLAAVDPRIVAVYIEFAEFQAGWASATELRAHLDNFAKSKKPIYAYADSFNELKYYIASSANKIFTEPSGDFEFNGLSVSEAFLKGLFQKLEVEPRVFRVGRFKAAVEPFILDQMSPENKKQNQELLGDIWAEIRSKVSLATKVEGKTLDLTADQLSAVSGADAKKIGLVTDLMFRDEIEDILAEMTVGKDKELNLVSPNQLLRDSRSIKLLEGHGKKKIAVIFADGEIHSGEGSRDSIGAESITDDIKEAANDEDVAAIVLRVNSPGGDALASDVIWREVTVADEKVPVVVSMGDVAASGGYYMSTGGRYIFAEPTTITGSIGVFGLMFSTEKFFRNKAGVNFDHVMTHAHSDIGNTNLPMSEFEAKIIQGDVERVYKRFLDVVQEGRGYEKREDLESIAEGRVWSGTRAKEIGLVDEIGGMAEALKKAAEFAKLNEEYRVEIYPRDSDPVTHFIERLSGDAVRASLAKTRWAQAAAALHLFDATPEMGMKSGVVYARMYRDLTIH
jgi:protease-4